MPERGHRGSGIVRRQSVRVWVAFWVGALLIGAVALLLWLQNSTVVWPQMDSWAPVDSRTILVRVYAGPCSWTRVGSVEESATAVRVGVDTMPCPQVGAGSDALDLRELTVRLSGDLGMRSVEDAVGRPIPQR